MLAIDVPNDANLRDFLRKRTCELLCAAYSCAEKSLPAAVPAVSSLCRWWKARHRKTDREALEKEVREVRQQFHTDLPVPVPVASELSLRPTETILEFVARFNYRCCSKYRAEQKDKALERLQQHALEASNSATSATHTRTQPGTEAANTGGVRSGFASGSRGKRSDQYAAHVSAYVARQRTTEGGLRSLQEAAPVLMTAAASQSALDAIPAPTTARKFFDVDDRFYGEQADRLLGGSPLVLSADSARTGHRNFIAFLIAGYLPEETCVYREVFSVQHLAEGTGLAYDLAKAKAFAARSLDERSVIWMGLDSAGTNIGQERGMLQRSRERLNAPLLDYVPCLEHGSNGSYLHGLLSMTGEPDTRSCHLFALRWLSFAVR